MDKEVLDKIKKHFGNLGMDEDDSCGQQKDDFSDETGETAFYDPAVIALLLNKNFGLREIKKEIKCIERRLNSPVFGLFKIKKEIKDIEEKLDNPDCGLDEIKSEVASIEAKLDSSTFGLAEIKSEVSAIEQKLDNPSTGLAEIKYEIRDIEEKLDSPVFGLSEIKSEVSAIEQKLDNPSTGLAEIKDEIRDIELKLDLLVPAATNKLTTGPVVKDVSTSSVVIKVLNNTNQIINVTAELFDIGTCPNPKSLLQSVPLQIQPHCAASAILQEPSVEWEVVYTGISPGVYVFTGGRNNAEQVPISSSMFVEANTFRHSEHVPSISSIPGS